MYKSESNFQSNPKHYEDENLDFLKEEEVDEPNSNEDIDE